MRSNNATTTIINGGSISASSGSGLSYGLYLSGGAASISNTGSISGQSASVYAGAQVASVLNWQGGNAADAKSTALTWSGTLPGQYTLGVVSPTRYGQIWFSNPSGAMAVSMDSSSTLAPGSYAKAVTGVNAAAISSSAGMLGLLTWQLSLSDTSNLYWDLLVTPIGIASGEIKAVSALNLTFLPYFFGGTLQIGSNASNYSDNFVLDASSTKSVALGGNSTTFSGVFPNATASAGHITFSGGGTATLTGNNSYSGGTDIDSTTTLQIGAGGTTGTIGSGAINNSGTLPINRSDAYTLANDISGTGNLSQVGAGTTTLTGTNTYGTTTISAGTLQVGNGGVSGSLGTGNVVNDGVLVFQRSDELKIQNAISGSGKLTQTGSGKLILTASNNYSGPTFISAGTLQIGNGGNSGTLGSGTLTNDGLLLVNRSGILALNMRIEGSGSVALDGGGTTTLGGTNIFSGGIQVAAGSTLSITDSAALGSGPVALVGSSTVPAYFKINGSTSIANRISVQGDPVFDIAPGAIVSISNAMVDGISPGDVMVQGGGKLALLAANTYTGPTTISAGSTLALADAGSIAKSSSVSNQGKLDIRGITGNSVTLTQFSQGAGGQLLMRTNPTSTQSLNVSGTASLNGTLTLSAQAGSYKSGIFKLIAADQVSGRFSSVSTDLGNYVRSYTLLYGPQGVDLEMLLRPDAANSRQALGSVASAQTTLMKQRNQLLSDMLSQECLPSRAGQSCMAMEGRTGRSTLGNEGTGLISGAWQVLPTLRVGGYAEQGDVKLSGSGVGFNSNAPGLGGFVRWNAQTDGSGLQARMSFATHSGSLQITRDKTLADTEAGSGTAWLQSYALGVELAWAVPVSASTVLKPYLSVQDTRSQRDAYTESSAAEVTSPMNYDAFEHNTRYTTLGLGMSGIAAQGLSYQISAALQFKERRYGSAFSGSSLMYQLETFALDMRDASANPEFVGAADVRYHLGKDQQLTAKLAMRGPISDAPQVFKAALGYQVSF